MQNSNRVADFQAECCEAVYEGLMNRCFLNALKKNINMTHDMAKECAKYSTSVLRNAGGISLLTDAIESADPVTKRFLSRISDECVAISTEMSKDMILADAVKSALEAEEPMDDNFEDDDMMDEPEPEDTTLTDEMDNLDSMSAVPEMPKEFKNKDISEIQLDTRITEKELNALKTAANKTDLDDMAGIISDKVANVLQAEKVQRAKLTEEKERIKNAIMDNPSNEISDDSAAEAAMDRILAVPMSKLGMTVYNTLFSTLQRRAIESVMAYGNTNIPVADILTELTINNTYDIFKPVKKTFESVITQASFMSAATEGCCDDEKMDDVISKATTFATIVYTMLEMLHTSKLHCCSPMDVRHMMTKNPKDVAPTNDVANVINRDYVRAVEENKRRIYKCTEAEDVEAIRAKLVDSKINIITAKESGMAINDDVLTQICGLIDIANQRIADLSKPAAESTVLDRMTTARAADLGNLNLIASSIKYKNFDNIRFKCVEATGANGTFNVFAESKNNCVYKTQLDVVGMEGVEPDKYIKFLVGQSRFNGMVKNGEPVDYVVEYDSKKIVF